MDGAMKVARLPNKPISGLVQFPKPTAPQRQNPDFHTDLQHYKTDFASLDKQERTTNLLRKLQMLEKTKLDRFERSLKRWEQIESSESMEQNAMHVRKKKYLLGQQLQNSLPINPVSNQVAKDDRGSQLTHNERV